MGRDLLNSEDDQNYTEPITKSSKSPAKISLTHPFLFPLSKVSNHCKLLASNNRRKTSNTALLPNR